MTTPDNVSSPSSAERLVESGGLSAPGSDALRRAFDTIVIGGGSTGLSAALMLARACRRVLVIDSGAARNRFASHMHGVLGHDGASPADLLARGRKELSAYGVEIVSGEVADVSEIARGLSVALADGATHYARTVLVASGLTDELPQLPGLADLWGGPVFGCPYCHGWEVRNQRWGVLGTSPVVAHQALLARQWTKNLTVFDTEGAFLNTDVRARLEARGASIVDSPVTVVSGEEGELQGVRTADGAHYELDALLVGSQVIPRDGFLTSLSLERVDSPMGSLLSTDPMGRTSHPRVWAAGNVVDPRLNVPGVIGQAAMIGGAINMALVEEDTDNAALTGTVWPEVAEDGYWERLYSSTSQRWSATPNGALVSLLSEHLDEVPHAQAALGRALDVGCGEGADAIWLAKQGWDTLGVDVAQTAIDRAETAARGADLPHDRLRFSADGVLGVPSSERFELACVSFLHAPAQNKRESLLRATAGLVARDGLLFVLSHVMPDDGQPASSETAANDEARRLGLDGENWRVLRASTAARTVVAPSGDVVERADRAILLQRL